MFLNRGRKRRVSIMQAAATSPKKLKFSEEELPKTPPKSHKKSSYGKNNCCCNLMVAMNWWYAHFSLTPLTMLFLSSFLNWKFDKRNKIGHCTILLLWFYVLISCLFLPRLLKLKIRNYSKARNFKIHLLILFLGNWANDTNQKCILLWTPQFRNQWVDLRDAYSVGVYVTIIHNLKWSFAWFFFFFLITFFLGGRGIFLKGTTERIYEVKNMDGVAVFGSNSVSCGFDRERLHSP